MSVVKTASDRPFDITWADTPAAVEFADLVPLTLTMTDHVANEKYATLPALTTDPYRPGRINAGDVMRYGSDALVVCYKSFDSTFSYTRLGWIEDPTGLAEALGSGDVEVSFRQSWFLPIPFPGNVPRCREWAKSRIVTRPLSTIEVWHPPPRPLCCPPTTSCASSTSIPTLG